jgi:hypothetical protein
MTKIILTDKQIADLKSVNAPFDPDMDYDPDGMDNLLEFLENYVVMHEIIDDSVTPLGTQLLIIHDDIIVKYDR